MPIRTIALFLALAVCIPVSAAELDLEESLKNQAAALLRAGNFAEFDRLATGLRDSSARTPAGTWELSMFYSGVERAGSNDADNAAWARLEAGAAQYLREHADSPTAVVLDAKVLIEHAAAYRGDGYASQIPKSRWAPFHAHVDAAVDVLESHREAGSADPEWYAIYVWAKNLRDVSKQQIFAFAGEALQRYPRYYPIHYRTARALLPKWGGSKELMQQYLALALERTRADEGTQIYGRVMFNLAGNSNRPREELAEIDAKWVLVKASYEEILQRYPDPYNLEALRAMACLAEKKEDYQAITRRVTGSTPSVAWFDTPQKQRDCDDWAFRNRSLGAERLAERIRALPLAPLIPIITAVALGLLQLFRRRAAAPARVVTKPVDGMAEIGMPVDQSQGFRQLLLILAAGALAFIAAWIAFHFLR
jgi:hypothetical protein